MIRVWMAVLMLAVAGCGPVYETVYSFQPPRSAHGQQCVGQCQQISQYCRQNCRLREDSCRANARQEAALQYDRYVREQRRAHLEVTKGVSDFDRSYNCSGASSCTAECDTDYRMCFTNCGGVVTARQQCTMFCDQQH